MIDVLAVFAAMDQALEALGFLPESEHYSPEAFGSRSRLYRRSAHDALSLTWDGRDQWFVVAGGVPWRDLAIYRSRRGAAIGAQEIVATLLGEATRVLDPDRAI